MTTTFLDTQREQVDEIHEVGAVADSYSTGILVSSPGVAVLRNRTPSSSDPESEGDILSRRAQNRSARR